jgi:hypothetical protein
MSDICLKNNILIYNVRFYEFFNSLAFKLFMISIATFITIIVVLHVYNYYKNKKNPNNKSDGPIIPPFSSNSHYRKGVMKSLLSDGDYRIRNITLDYFSKNKKL